VIVRNHTPFRSNVQCREGMYLAIIERRLWRQDKDVGAESDLLNDLGFNLYVALKGCKRELHTGTNKTMLCQLPIAC